MGKVKPITEKLSAQEKIARTIRIFEKKEIDMVFFYSIGCEECAEAKEVIIPELEAKYNIKFNIDFYNAEEEEAFELIMKYEEELNAESKTIPTIIINNKMLSTIEEIRTDLEKEVKAMI